MHEYPASPAALDRVWAELCRPADDVLDLPRAQNGPGLQQHAARPDRQRLLVGVCARYAGGGKADGPLAARPDDRSQPGAVERRYAGMRPQPVCFHVSVLESGDGNHRGALLSGGHGYAGGGALRRDAIKGAGDPSIGATGGHRGGWGGREVGWGTRKVARGVRGCGWWRGGFFSRVLWGWCSCSTHETH